MGVMKRRRRAVRELREENNNEGPVRQPSIPIIKRFNNKDYEISLSIVGRD